MCMSKSVSPMTLDKVQRMWRLSAYYQHSCFYCAAWKMRSCRCHDCKSWPGRFCPWLPRGGVVCVTCCMICCRRCCSCCIRQLQFMAASAAICNFSHVDRCLCPKPCATISNARILFAHHYVCRRALGIWWGHQLALVLESKPCGAFTH